MPYMFPNSQYVPKANRLSTWKCSSWVAARQTNPYPNIVLPVMALVCTRGPLHRKTSGLHPLSWATSSWEILQENTGVKPSNMFLACFLHLFAEYQKCLFGSTSLERIRVCLPEVCGRFTGLNRAWIYFCIFVVFIFVFFGLASFSFSIGFPSFSSLFLCFPLVFVGVPCFSIVFPACSSLCLCFSFGFRWLSLFLSIGFASSYVFIGFLVFSWFLCVFILVFLHVFLFLMFSTGFWFYCIFLSVLLFLPWICFIWFHLSLVVLHIPDFLFLPPLVFVHCPHSFLLQHIWLLLVLVVVVVGVVVVVVVVGGGGGGGGGCCCCLGLFCELTGSVFVNDVAVLLSLNQRAAGGQPLEKAGGGSGREGAAPPPAMRFMLLVVVCVVVCVRLLLLFLLIEAMLYLKNVVVFKKMFVAFVALPLLLLFLICLFAMDLALLLFRSHPNSLYSYGLHR